jgi:beta-xylosidase
MLWGDQGDGTFRNPILPADFSDIDCIRVGEKFYAITSTFQYSPGMTVIESTDLVNWEIVGNAVADLRQIGPELNYDRMNRPGAGIWAGAIRHHAGKFRVYFGTPNEGFFMTTAAKPEGPWEPLTKLLDAPGWDDCCPFWDDDGQAWFIGSHFALDPANGKKYNIHLWKMTPDGKALVEGSDRIIYQAAGSEANKLFKHGDTYFHYFSEIRRGQRVPMMGSAKSITGPYEYRQLMHVNSRTDLGPNQGGILSDTRGKWWFFTHHGTGHWEGRAASLLPVTWVDGWPIPGRIGADGIGNMMWSHEKPYPATKRRIPRRSDDFSADVLAPQWQWHYQPKDGSWSLTERPGFMRLHALRPLARDHIGKVGNLLTQRAWCVPGNQATAVIDLSGMVDGQQAGLVAHSPKVQGGIAVLREKGRSRMFFRRNDGIHTPGADLAAGQTTLHLRMEWGTDAVCRFSYSNDGTGFTPLGDVVAFPNPYTQYRGGRVGIYTYHPAGKGGHVDIDRFDYTITGPGGSQE